jgi:hypothetical protein
MFCLAGSVDCDDHAADAIAWSDPDQEHYAGDHQVPEGYYRASSLAYWSRFHLGLGVNYPNRSDRILGRKNFYGAKSPFMATAHRSAVWR